MPTLTIETGVIGVARAALLDRAEETAAHARKYVSEGKQELAGDLARLAATFANAYLELKQAKFL